MSRNGRSLSPSASVRPLVFPPLEAGPVRAVRPPVPAPEPVDAPAAGLAPVAALDAAQRARLRAEGFEAGLVEGRAAGQREGSERLAAVTAALEEAGKALLAQRIELAAEVERQLPRLVLLLAQKVLQQELALSDTSTRTVVRGLTQRLAGCDRPVAVRLAPPALAALEAWRRSTAESVPALSALRLEADPGLGSADWIVETRDGFLDGRVESQLESAWQLLAELGA